MVYIEKARNEASVMVLRTIAAVEILEAGDNASPGFFVFDCCEKCNA